MAPDRRSWFPRWRSIACCTTAMGQRSRSTPIRRRYRHLSRRARRRAPSAPRARPRRSCGPRRPRDRAIARPPPDPLAGHFLHPCGRCRRAERCGRNTATPHTDRPAAGAVGATAAGGLRSSRRERPDDSGTERTGYDRCWGHSRCSRSAVSSGLAIGGVTLLLVAGVSRRLSNTPVTPAMVVVAVGVLVGPLVLDDLTVPPTSSTVRTLAEATLAVVLFSDSARVDLRALRREATVPLRLLGVGLPLTIVLGGLAAVALFGSFSLSEALILGVILAPTDAGLGSAVVTDTRLPQRRAPVAQRRERPQRWHLRSPAADRARAATGTGARLTPSRAGRGDRLRTARGRRRRASSPRRS